MRNFSAAMNRLSSLLLLMLFCGICAAQDFDYKRDFEKLLKQSKDKESKLYYPTLLKRFNDGDSTLTDYEVIALEIGFTDNENYKPYESLDRERSIKKLLGEEKYAEAIDSCNALLATYPVNFTAIEEMGFAYWKLNKDSIAFYKEKCMKIVRAIKFSGDGTNEQPFFVLGPADGQLFIRYILRGKIGYMGSGRDKNGYFIDILEMKKEGEEARTLYFNIDHAMNHSDFKKENENTAKELEKKGVKFIPKK